VQTRVAGSCGAAHAVRAINENGSVNCEPMLGGGDITSVTAGPGLNGGGPNGDVTLNVHFAGPGSATTAARSDHTHYYGNVVTVAKSGAAFTSIQGALDSILDAGANNPYLVWVGPGVYNERVTMKPYVEIAGAGQLATRITFTGSGSNTTGTVVAAGNATLRSVTVENTGGAAYALAIYVNAASPRLIDLTATASGDNNISAAVFVNGAASPTITDATLTAVGAGNNHYALYVLGASTPTVSRSTITASGAAVLNHGVLSAISSPTTIRDSVVRGATSAVQMTNSPGRFAATLLDGGATTTGSGTLTCAGAYNQNFVALNAACQ
jgi:hypothetical protein